MRRSTRRRLLQVGTAAEVAGVSGTAGCLGFLGGNGSGTTEPGSATGTGGQGTTAASGGGTNPYLKWLPAPAEFADGEEYGYNYYGIAGFQQQRDTLHKTVYNRGTRAVRPLEEVVGIDPTNVGGVLQLGTSGTRVAVGEFDPAAITKELGDRKFVSRESYRGHQLFLQLGEDSRAIAVGESSVLVCRRSAGTKPLAVARMLVDTNRGDVDRYFAVNEDFRLATDPLQNVSRAGVQLMEPNDESAPAEGRFAGNTAFGFGFVLGGSTTDMRFVFVFEERSGADPDAVRTFAEEGLPGLNQYEEYGVQQDGRTVHLTGSVQTERFDFLVDGDPGEG